MQQMTFIWEACVHYTRHRTIKQCSELADKFCQLAMISFRTLLQDLDVRIFPACKLNDIGDLLFQGLATFGKSFVHRFLKTRVVGEEVV